jgi:hypothetical protein
MPIKMDVCQNDFTTIVDVTEVDKYMICMCMKLIIVNIRNKQFPKNNEQIEKEFCYITWTIYM